MASLHMDSRGARIVQFVDRDRRRRTLRLGKIAHKSAEAIRLRVEKLNAASIIGEPPDDETSRWVANKAGQTLVDKLAALGLIAKRANALLAPFLDGFIAERTDVKPRTHLTYKNVRRNLISYFGESKALREITAADCESFRRELLRKALSQNTVRRRCAIGRQIFKVAVDQGVIPQNPFKTLRGLAVQANRSRDFFVDAALSQRVLAALPNAEWRAVFSLARWGGLRVPSEILTLRWSDIDWKQNRMLIRSQKTEGHAGHETRECPLFPEVQAALNECWDAAVEGQVSVIVKLRSCPNFPVTFGRLLENAAIPVWEKPFVNCRATRATELAEQWPGHVAAKWLGHSQKVADRHYRQITDQYFAKAAGALHGALQQGAQLSVTGGNEIDATRLDSTLLPSIALHYRQSIGPPGLEPGTNKL